MSSSKQQIGTHDLFLILVISPFALWWGELHKNKEIYTYFKFINYMHFAFNSFTLFCCGLSIQ